VEVERRNDDVWCRIMPDMAAIATTNSLSPNPAAPTTAPSTASTHGVLGRIRILASSAPRPVVVVFNIVRFKFSFTPMLLVVHALLLRKSNHATRIAAESIVKSVRMI
jgi:hypothetical protein